MKSSPPPRWITLPSTQERPTPAAVPALAAWQRFRAELARGEPQAELRLRAVLEALLARAAAPLEPASRAEACASIAAALGERMRGGALRTAPELLAAADVEIARLCAVRGLAVERPADALLSRLRACVGELAEPERTALRTHYAGCDATRASDIALRRRTLVELRQALASTEPR